MKWGREPVSGALPQRNGFHTRRLGLLRGEGPFRDHPLEDKVPAPESPVRIAEGVEAARIRGDPHQHRRFADREFGSGLVQVELGGGLDSVVALPEEHLIRVEGENLFLPVGPLDAGGGDGFADLALERLLPVQKQLAGHLLGNRARPGDDPALPVVGQERSRDPDRIEAVVPPENVGLPTPRRHRGGAGGAARTRLRCAVPPRIGRSRRRAGHKRSSWRWADSLPVPE